MKKISFVLWVELLADFEFEKHNVKYTRLERDVNVHKMELV